MFAQNFNMYPSLEIPSQLYTSNSFLRGHGHYIIENKQTFQKYMRQKEKKKIEKSVSSS